ncbi:phage antirepressor KilAC domain-containing protein [Pseudomonas knackmussii]|uniref:phage antirepressor KilAC domain-containing protein n=1 Tax=Pseudomonas knackmussii TaxID=65741 RepID=UPI003BD755BC
MSTQEIAALTGKQHKNVIRDVRNMLAALAADGSEVSHVREDRDSRDYTTNYHLNRELTETLITGYDVALRHRVVRRLHELEAQVVGLIAIPSTLPDALRLAAELAEQVAEQAPKIAAFELLQGAGGTLNLTSAATHLGVERYRLTRWLSENRWMYRRVNTKPWLAYQTRIQQGLVANKVSVIGTTDEGDQRCASQFRITPKGLAVLATKVAEGAL